MIFFSQFHVVELGKRLQLTACLEEVGRFLLQMTDRGDWGQVQIGEWGRCYGTILVLICSKFPAFRLARGLGAGDAFSAAVAGQAGDAVSVSFYLVRLQLHQGSS